MANVVYGEPVPESHGLQESKLDPNREILAGLHHLEHARDEIEQATKHMRQTTQRDEFLQITIARAETIINSERSRIEDIYNQALEAGRGLKCNFPGSERDLDQASQAAFSRFRSLANDPDVGVNLVERRNQSTVTILSNPGLGVEVRGTGEDHQTHMIVKVPREHPIHSGPPFHEVSFPFGLEASTEVEII